MAAKNNGDSALGVGSYKDLHGKRVLASALGPRPILLVIYISASKQDCGFLRWMNRERAWQQHD